MEEVGEASRRKLAAKRANERVKLLANTLNALAIGVAGAGLIVPIVGEPTALFDAKRPAWLLFAAILHVCAQGALGLLRSED